jgi:hypothetical protein
MTEHKAFEGGRMVWCKTIRSGLLAIAGLVLALFILAVACGGDESEESTATATPVATATGTPLTTVTPGMSTPIGTPSPSPCVPQAPVEGQANLFHNADFESGEEPWCTVHPGESTKFQVSQDYAHSGESSALLQMRVPAEEEGHAKVFYLVQEVTPEEFPELISGYYRVENWIRGTPKQYLQFVVIAFDVPNLPGGYPNHQMRYPLAGISEEPFEIGNAYFVFIGKGEPVTGEWVYFERNIREDFQQFWGAAPEGFSKIRILFEVRYDEKEAGLTPAEADVYYDDLYMGPASENPNKP